MIEKKEVEWLARLAKLKLSDEELDGLTEDMEEIVEFAGRINSAVSGTEAYRGVVTPVEALREDVVGDCSPQDLVLSNVNGGENGYFPVKRRKPDGSR